MAAISSIHQNFKKKRREKILVQKIVVITSFTIIQLLSHFHHKHPLSNHWQLVKSFGAEMTNRQIALDFAQRRS